MDIVILVTEGLVSVTGTGVVVGSSYVAVAVAVAESRGRVGAVVARRCSRVVMAVAVLFTAVGKTPHCHWAAVM